MAQYAEFRDKVVLITGAGSGIGRVTAEAFAAQGAIVVVSDINDLAGKQTVQKILSNGQKAEFIQCDVSDESQVKTMIENIVKHHGKWTSHLTTRG